MQRSLARQPNQVPVPRLILRQHQKVVVLVPIPLSPMVRILADIQLTAQNRLQVLLLHRVEEVHRAVDIAMVGHRRRSLAKVAQVRRQFVDIACPVKKRVISM
jgi:hypothetical protein